MKRQYIKPELNVYELNTHATILANSLVLNSNSEDAVDEEEVLSRQSGFSLWDDDEE